MPFMSKKIKVLAVVFLIIVILCIALWILFNAFLVGITPNEIKQIHHTRAKLLYHTDHEEVLRICREKLASYNEKISDKSKKQSDYNPDLGPMGGAKGPWKRTYMHILDLRPTFVDIDPEMIHLEMCTGFYSVGLHAFPEGVEGHGDLKLLDGLWYSDDGFQKYPNFSDYLEELKDYRLNE
jgi:hypothetical protein